MFFAEIEKIAAIPARPFEFYTAEILWNDPHISKHMLALHLEENTELASRKKSFIERSVAWMASLFPVGPSFRIADFGCGPGLYTTLFAERGACVTGIDFSERSIGYARETALSKGLDIDYRLGNYLFLEGLPENSFDLVTMIYCDFCALSPEQRKILLRRFFSLLTSGGAVILDVFSMKAFEERREDMEWGYRLMNGFWSPEPYYGFRNTVVYREERVVLDKYDIVEEHRVFQVYNWLQYFDKKDLRREFESENFVIEAFYGDVEGSPEDAGASQIAVIARKK